MKRLLSVAILLLAGFVTAPAAFASHTLTAASVGTQSTNPVSAGGAVTYTISTTWTGSGSTCTTNTLSISGLPTGATGVFNPTTVTSAATTSTLTVSTTGATPAGTNNFTVTVSTTASGSCGSTVSFTPSGSLVVTADATVTTTSVVSSSVNPSLVGQSVTFTSRIAPASGAVVPTGTVQFQIDSANFGSAVTIGSCSPSPDACATSAADAALAAGNHTVTAAFTPTANTNTGTVDFTNTQGPNAGDTITIGGTTYTWSSSHPPAVGSIYYSNTNTNAALNLLAAIMGNSALCGDANCINASQTANASAVATGLTANVTTITNKTAANDAFSATFSNSSTYTIAPASGGIPAAFGSSSGTLSGGQQVNNPTPSTITAVSLGAQTPSPVTANSSATYSVTATWAGGATCTSVPLVFNGTLPTGATASFSPTTVSTSVPTSTLTISTTDATPAGTTTGLSVTATSTGGTGTCGTSSVQSSSTSLVVQAPRTITAVTAGAQTPSPVTPPNSSTYLITTTWTGNGTCTSIPLVFNGTLPTGANASFSPTTVSNSSTTSTLTITTSASTPGGTTAFTVTAASTGGTGNCGSSSVPSSSANFVVNAQTITATTVGAQNPNPVAPGSSATYTITTTWSIGPVCTSIPLVLNGTLPTGATASFSPTTVSSTTATSTLTISTSASTPAGSTSFTVTASSTGGTGNCGTSSITSSNATLVVTAETITATTVGAQNPNPVAPGSSATYTITTTWTGAGVCTSAPLTINWTPPTGATAVFSPTTVSNITTTTTLTLSTTASTPAGTTGFTVTAASTGGTGACGTSSVTSSAASLVVTPETITTVTVGTQTPNPVTAGSSATYSITTAWTGAGNCTSVPLTINWTAPTGATAAFSPTTVSNGTTTSTLTITTTSATPGGTTPFTVTATTTGGTGACGTSSVTSSSHNLVVTDEVVTATTVGTQTPNPMIQGSSATYTITTTWSGSGSCTSIPLVLNGALPTGATASFSPTTVSNSATTSTLTISTTGSTPAGTTTGLTVTASTTGGTGSCGTSSINSASFNFVVATPASVTAVTVGAQTPNPVNQGSSATYSITTTWTGTATCTPIVTVNWTGGTPAGVTTSFSPTITSVATSSTLTVTTTSATPASSTFTVTATSTGGGGGTACGTGTVTSSPASTLAVTPIATITAVTVGAETPGSVGPAQAATYAITTTWSGTGVCTPVVTVTWTTTPTGATTNFSPTIASNQTTSTLTINTSASAATGTYAFTVKVASTGGTGGCGTGSITSASASFVIATATINAANVLSQTPNPVPQGSSATFPITSQWSGTGVGCTSNPLQINWTPPSADTTATFNPPTVSSGSTTSTLTITTFADTPPSTTSFTVTVSNNLGGGCSSNNSVLTNTANLVVSGNASPSITKSFTPANIAPSNTSTLTLVISASAADLSNLTNVSVSDPFPSGMQVASTPAATNSCTTGSTAGTFTAPAAATTISYSGATIAPGGSCTLTVNVTASTPGTYVNTTGTVTAGNVSVPGNSATATLTIYGAPTQLAFGTGPSNTSVGSVITPAVTVQVEDAGGNVVTNSSASITIAIGNEGTGPGNGSLSGTLTIAASSGIATFSSLVINRIGTGYTLVASSTGLTSATSNTFNIVQPSDNYTEPFLSGHGWTYTQLTCTGDTCANNAAVSSGTDCQVTPCVSAEISTSAVLAAAQTMTGYFHNPAGYTWNSIGVPAGANVNNVQGSWWDLVVPGGSGCSTAANTTAGMHIYNSANTTEITLPPVFADTSVLSDVEGATHGPGTAVPVNSGFTAASTAITLRFDINPSAAGELFGSSACTIYGDSFNLLITYTPPTGGRRGQVIIGFLRMPNGDFQMTKPVLVPSTQDRAEDGRGSGNAAILSKRTE